MIRIQLSKFATRVGLLDNKSQCDGSMDLLLFLEASEMIKVCISKGKEDFSVAMQRLKGALELYRFDELELVFKSGPLKTLSCNLLSGNSGTSFVVKVAGCPTIKFISYHAKGGTKVIEDITLLLDAVLRIGGELEKFIVEIPRDAVIAPAKKPYARNRKNSRSFVPPATDQRELRGNGLMKTNALG